MSAQTPVAEIGLVVALPVEADSFGVRHSRAGDCKMFDWGEVAIAGLGFERAAAAAKQLVERGARALLSWGVAGGLSPTLSPGDLLLPSRVIVDDGEWNTDAGLRERVRRALDGHAVESGNLYCSRVPITSLDEKKSLAARGMFAVDMESAAVAEVARDAGLPFVAVKAICDPASREIPPIALRLLDDNGGLRWRALPGLVREGSRIWRELNLLRSDLAAARGSLQRAARLLPRCVQP